MWCPLGIAWRRWCAYRNILVPLQFDDHAGRYRDQSQRSGQPLARGLSRPTQAGVTVTGGHC